MKRWLLTLSAALVFAALFFFVPGLSALQVLTWVQRFPSQNPGARFFHSMAYDEARGGAVLFGGFTGQDALADTWAWNGSDWVQRFPVQSPPVRYSHAMAYDGAREEVVLFGGFPFPAGTLFSDTWLWNGVNWTQSPTSGPSRRGAHSMAYDSGRRETLLFGGSSQTGGVLGDTWIWNGANWIQLFPTEAPPARMLFGMAYDEARGEVVLFGGTTLIAGQVFGDTWVWDGINWAQKSSIRLPPARRDHKMVYDRARQRVVLFGGISNDIAFSDTWSWDGSNWTEEAPLANPGPRARYGLAFDSTRNEAVLFGGTGYSAGVGFADTWVWSEVTVPDPVPIGPEIHYFALGDSVASGHGLMDDGTPCRRSDLAYPSKVAERLKERYKEVHFTSLACSGARVNFPVEFSDPHKFFSNQVNDVVSALRRIDGVPTVVTITIGANDFGWTELRQFTDLLYLSNLNRFQRIVNRIGASVRRTLRQQVPRLLRFQNVTVVLTEYHNPFNTNSVFFLGPGGRCGLIECYDRTEYAIHTLNNAIVQAYVDLGRPSNLKLTPIHGLFHGHESPRPSCGNNGPEVNDTWVQYKDDPDSNSFPFRLDSSWRGDCMHPNSRGTDFYAAQVNSDLIGLSFGE